MFGDTITLNTGTIADPVEITLKKINQDGYSSEYRFKDDNSIHTFLIRHSTEKNRVKGALVARHNVTYTREDFADDIHPQGRTVQVYLVIRTDPERDTASTVELANAVSLFAVDNADRVVELES